TPLKVIEGDQGRIMHGIRSDDETFFGFGEVYFSTVNGGDIKSWRRHSVVTLNLLVPHGQIRFVLCDDRQSGNRIFWEVTLSLENYYRLTIPPGVWLAFQGMTPRTNMLLDLIDAHHDPDEADKLPLEAIPYAW
ncbi:MAG: dTDP-4-dehydrorhamnose 3,5-epimerase, partial [Verrucomicrobiae bacterium]|nr:dTDP-4-dehydrorhamnose 3,5-epimerase [Verrucomicrobiae bacterium]